MTPGSARTGERYQVTQVEGVDRERLRREMWSREMRMVQPTRISVPGTDMGALRSSLPGYGRADALTIGVGKTPHVHAMGVGTRLRLIRARVAQACFLARV